MENHDMTVSLSEMQVTIVLGARLMYMAVPFHRTTKRILDDREMQLADGFRETLLAARATVRNGSRQTTVRLPASSDELRIYSEMLRACLEECRNSRNDLWAHLGTVDEAEALTLLEYLESTGD